MPRVSVVIPVYNAEPYLDEAVESVLGQSFDDFEVILVDDGSTDGSRGHIERLVKNESRVRGVYQANAGPSAARNAGIAAAEGQYIAFCDADDVQRQHRLATEVSMLDRFLDVALVGADLSELVDGRITKEHALHHFWIGPLESPLEDELAFHFGAYKSCGELGLPVPPAYQPRRVFAGRAAPLIALMHLCWGNASMFRREAIDEVGGFDVTLGQYEDWHLVARIALRHPIAFVDVPVMNYRRHPTQISQNPAAAARGILRVIDDVWMKTPGFYRTNRDIVDRVRGAAHYQIASAAVAASDFRTAEQHFLRSARSYPAQKRVYVDLLKAALKNRVFS